MIGSVMGFPNASMCSGSILGSCDLHMLGLAAFMTSGSSSDLIIMKNNSDVLLVPFTCYGEILSHSEQWIIGMLVEAETIHTFEIELDKYMGDEMFDF